MINLGSRVGGYTVLRSLGQGGMGQVFLAEHQRIARRAAIKVLLPELSSNATVVERFFSEARATSVIRHPGIVEVIDCDVLEGQAFIVMEYLEGESLAAYLRRRGGLRADVRFSLALTAQVASAVGAAHAHGIVHRDLKPDNIFLALSPDQARVNSKVLDFGIAKLVQHVGASKTRTGSLIGTPAYMSPEQCRGGTSLAVDARSDVYSLGCVLYEALCGRPPFAYEGMGDLIVAQISENPERPGRRIPELAPVIDSLVMRMLAKSPGARPPTMDAVAGELQLCLETIGATGDPADIQPVEPVLAPVELSERVPPIASNPTPPTLLAPDNANSRPSTTGSAGGTRLLPEGIEREERASARSPHAMTTLAGAAAEGTPGPRTRRARTRLWVLLSAVAVAGGFAVVFALSPSSSSHDDPSRTTATSAAGVETSPQPRPPAPPPEQVTIDVRGLPTGATLFLDGKPAGGLPLKLARGVERHVLTVRAPGYDDRALDIDAANDRVVDLVMGMSAHGAPSQASPGAASAAVEPAQGPAPRHPPRRKTAGHRSKSATPGEPEESNQQDAITDI